ncbi:hypothetical protein JR316_0001540 [Psilocybe cubensis]|uniref:Uncharacterized protein n=2 Tax=Psilocybe cubensis TaxID=181762 RepID=A0A8H7Y6S2_PSICU|nr:hypothetical protein JR316_0001540 [Psilocybe cubensis]KAH9487464.1 hypothetical protein JR316_0001540 [Psilocybe cubensis]
MTEYDYSPDAVERYLDKQAGIARWVDNNRKCEPANPFEPIPGEHAPSETYFQSSTPPQFPQAQHHHYPSQQPSYQVQQPYPVYYATAQGVISPTYGGPSKRHHRKHHHTGSHHPSGSKSLRPSPHTASAALPLAPVGLTYAPTPQRSVSTPPNMPVQSYFGYQPVQQQMVYPASSTSMVSPPATMQMHSQVQGFPFPPQQLVTSPPALAPAISHSTSYSSKPSSSSHTRRSRSHSRDRYTRSRAPHGTSNQYPTSPPISYGMQTMGPYGPQQFVTSPTHQPMVVPIHGGRSGYIVVPAGQSAVITGAGAQPSYYTPKDYSYNSGTYRYPDSDSESDSDSEMGDGFVHVHGHGPGPHSGTGYDQEHGHGPGSFFGSFKKLGTSLIGHKKSSSTISKRRRRRDSH